jgi:DNA-binding CsgD family transcriptional regulator/tetratricopeptide (TPR) repeat protein
LAGSVRRRLHRDAAVALAEGAADPAEIATHWWEAGDAEHAWAAALEAAERAERAFAFAESRLHLERALQLWPAGTEGRPECLLRAAEVAFLAGDAAAAVALAQRGLDQGAGDEAEVQIALGRYAADAFDFALSNAAFERAAALVRADAPGTTRAFALWGLARVRINQGRYAEARAAASEAVKIAHDAGDPSAEAAGRFARGMTHLFEGRLTGVADVERGVALAVQARSSAPTGAGYQFLSLLLHLAGELDRALDVALEGIDACDALGVARTHSSDLRARAALIQHELGRWDEADASLEPAEPRALPLLASALLAMRRGHFDLAELRIASAAPGRGAIGVTANGLDLARVELAWLRADPAAAWAILDAMPEEPGLWGASTAAEAARLAARLTADDSRREATPAPLIQHPDPRLDAALKAEIAAENARAEGTADPQLWAACTRAWSAARRPYDRTYARLREAEALFGVGAREPAKEALRDAAAAASALGARPLRALADELARRARVSPEPRRPRESHRDEPTPRELDVLALLAEGLTNREIAARLFLSPKTVGIHVSRLHQKLDAHTRGEAVAVARRRGILV